MAVACVLAGAQWVGPRGVVPDLRDSAAGVRGVASTLVGTSATAAAVRAVPLLTRLPTTLDRDIDRLLPIEGWAAAEGCGSAQRETARHVWWPDARNPDCWERAPHETAQSDSTGAPRAATASRQRRLRAPQAPPPHAERWIRKQRSSRSRLLARLTWEANLDSGRPPIRAPKTADRTTPTARSPRHAQRRSPVHVRACDPRIPSGHAVPVPSR